MDVKLSEDLITRLRAERTRIEGELQELEASTDAMEEDAVPAGVSSHMAEEANTTVEIEKNLAVRDTLQALLREIEYSLVRVEQGTYGICANCGQPINPARLEFMPHASLCIDCKGKLERGEIDNPVR